MTIDEIAMKLHEVFQIEIKKQNKILASARNWDKLPNDLHNVYLAFAKWILANFNPK